MRRSISLASFLMLAFTTVSSAQSSGHQCDSNEGITAFNRAVAARSPDETGGFDTGYCAFMAKVRRNVKPVTPIAGKVSDKFFSDWVRGFGAASAAWQLIQRTDRTGTTGGGHQHGAGNAHAGGNNDGAGAGTRVPEKKIVYKPGVEPEKGRIAEELSKPLGEESGSRIKEELSKPIAEESGSRIKEELSTRLTEESASTIKEELSTQIVEEPAARIKEDVSAPVKQKPAVDGKPAVKQPAVEPIGKGAGLVNVWGFIQIVFSEGVEERLERDVGGYIQFFANGTYRQELRIGQFNNIVYGKYRQNGNKLVLSFTYSGKPHTAEYEFAQSGVQLTLVRTGADRTVYHLLLNGTCANGACARARVSTP